MRRLVIGVSVAVVLAAGLSSQAEPIRKNGIENEPPWILCPGQWTVGAGTEKCIEIVGGDPDEDILVFSVQDMGSSSGVATLVGDGTLCFTPDLSDCFGQIIEMEIEVSDGFATASCIVEWNVVCGAGFQATIATPLDEVPPTPVAGTPISVNLRLDRAHTGDEIHSFSFLIGWDTTQLNFLQAVPGSIFDIPGTHEWEQFNYTIVDDCLGDCAGGLVRVEAVANIDGDGHAPTSLILEELSVPLILDFETVEGAVFDGDFIPVQFFWMDCDDNSLEFVADWTIPSGQILRGICGNVFDADLDEPWLQGQLREHASVFPSFYSPYALCRDLEPPIETISYIDFTSAFPLDWWQTPTPRLTTSVPTRPCLMS